MFSVPGGGSESEGCRSFINYCFSFICNDCQFLQSLCHNPVCSLIPRLSLLMVHDDYWLFVLLVVPPLRWCGLCITINFLSLLTQFKLAVLDLDPQSSPSSWSVNSELKATLLSLLNLLLGIPVWCEQGTLFVFLFAVVVQKGKTKQNKQTTKKKRLCLCLFDL